jgi:hypothetical protein
MAVHTIDTNKTTQLQITSTGESWLLKNGVSITTQDQAGIYMTGASDNSVLTVNGTVSANDINTDNGDFAGVISFGQDSQVEVGETGKVYGDVGVNLLASGQNLVNDGLIWGSVRGVNAQGQDMSIVNNGEIGSSDIGDGVRFFNADGKLENGVDGEISGGFGVHVVGGVDHEVLIVNKGTISSSDDLFEVAIYAEGEGSETIRNSGLIDGNVILGDGHDTFDSRKGAVEGIVIGGAGADTYVFGKTPFDISENANGGFDVIKSFASFTMEEDSNIEMAMLGGAQDLDLTGSGAGDTLYGNAGNNKISGLDGVDYLNGKTGNDILTGGLGGADTFMFRTGWGKDTVTDFEAGVDTLDLFGWSDIKSFNDLKQHHLSQVGDDLVISAGNDKLILKDMDTDELKASDIDFDGGWF